MKRFELKARLGAGSKATAFAAYDRKFQTNVALKVFLPSAYSDEKSEALLLNRCRLIALLPQTMCGKIYDFGKKKGEIYLVTELLEGHLLNDLNKERDFRGHKIETDKFLDALVWSLYNFVRYLKIRDLYWEIHPQNIFVGPDNEIRLLGLPDIAQAESGAPISMAASPFMPKEVEEGGLIRSRSWQYIYAAISVFALTGQPIPASRKALKAVVRQYTGNRKAKAIMKAMRHDPTKRFKDSKSFAVSGFGRRPTDNAVVNFVIDTFMKAA